MNYKVSNVKPPVQIHTCRNCKLTFSEKICNHCGEKIFHEEQLSTKNFMHQIFDFFLHWESKVFFFLIFGVFKKFLISFTIWTMH